MKQFEFSTSPWLENRDCSVAARCLLGLAPRGLAEDFAAQDASSTLSDPALLATCLTTYKNPEVQFKCHHGIRSQKPYHIWCFWVAVNEFKYSHQHLASVSFLHDRIMITQNKVLNASPALVLYFHTLGLQQAQSRPYLHTLGPKAGIIYNMEP